MKSAVQILLDEFCGGDPNHPDLVAARAEADAEIAAYQKECGTLNAWLDDEFAELTEDSAEAGEMLMSEAAKAKALELVLACALTARVLPLPSVTTYGRGGVALCWGNVNSPNVRLRVCPDGGHARVTAWAGCRPEEDAPDLESALEWLVDQLDVEQARKALAEAKVKGTVRLADLKAELGLPADRDTETFADGTVVDYTSRTVYHFDADGGEDTPMGEG